MTSPAPSLLSDIDTFFATRAAELDHHFAEATNGMRRVIAFGLLMLDTKERGKQTGVIPHGQFQKWIETHCPGVAYRTAARYMQLAEYVLEKTKSARPGTFDTLPLHQVLLAPPDILTSLPREVLEVREEIFSLVDGKSKNQLLFEFREETSPRPAAPRKPIDPKRAAADERQILLDQAQSTITAMNIWQDRHLLELKSHSRERLEALLEAGTALNNRIRAALQAAPKKGRS